MTPMILKTPRSRNDYEQSMLFSPNEAYIHKPAVATYRPAITTYRTYLRPVTPKYRYSIKQEGKSYRCCECCQYWCTRNCPTCDFCDRILACPFLFFILSGLFLFLLFIALLTLFSLHPNINSAQRYYGIISKLSIYNRTVYIYNRDRLCSATNSVNNCLNIVTSTGVSLLSTTITINRASQSMVSSHLLIAICLLIHLNYGKLMLQIFFKVIISLMMY